MTNGSLPLSGYRIAAFPQTNDTIVSKTLEYLAYHSNHSTHFGSNETGTLYYGDWIANSACVEVVCEPVFASIDHPGNATSTVTGLVPSMDYQLVIMALSNGTVLESRPSSPIAITTDVHGKTLSTVQSFGSNYRDCNNSCMIRTVALPLSLSLSPSPPSPQSRHS